MSSRAVYATKLNDKDCLIEALSDLCGPSNVKVREGSISARYQGRLASFDRASETENYNVTMAGRNDLQGIMVPDADNNGVYKLGQSYSKAIVMKAMRSIKGSVVKDEIEETGAQHIRIRVMAYDE